MRRAEPVLAVQAVTDGLARCSDQFPASWSVRNIGMARWTRAQAKHASPILRCAELFFGENAISTEREPTCSRRARSLVRCRVRAAPKAPHALHPTPCVRKLPRRALPAAGRQSEVAVLRLYDVMYDEHEYVDRR